MKLFENQLTVYYSISKQSNGFYRVVCEATYKNETESFSFVGSISQKYDRLTELNEDASNMQEVEQNYNDEFWSFFEERVVGWMYAIDQN